MRTDGGMATGRDVVIATMLGADEVSFGTSAMIAEGCIMARVCHKNTCPVGVATQDPELRKKFNGTPEMVMRFMTAVAEDVRYILADLGFRSLDEVVGHPEYLEQVIHGREAGFMDLSPLLFVPDTGTRAPQRAAAQRGRAAGRDAERPHHRAGAGGAAGEPRLAGAAGPQDHQCRTGSRARVFPASWRCATATAGLTDGHIRVDLQGHAGPELWRLCHLVA